MFNGEFIYNYNMNVKITMAYKQTVNCVLILLK